MTNDSTAPSLLPPDDDLDIIHTRRYETRVYRLNESEMLVRGAISDTKPPGLYVLDDPEELEIHQMQIEMKVKLPELEITDVRLVLKHIHIRHVPEYWTITAIWLG